MSNQVDVTRLTSILDLASQTTSCDNACMLGRITQALTDNAAQARQQYATVVSGNNQMLESAYTSQATSSVNALRTNYNTELAKLQRSINTYNSLFTQYNNSTDLLNKYLSENTAMTKQLKSQTNTILTNERKTFYEDQQNNQLNSYYYYILLIVYVIIVFTFGLFSLWYTSTYSWKVRAFMFLMFAVMPIIAPWMLGKIIQLLYMAYDMLPKNVYYTDQTIFNESEHKPKHIPRYRRFRF
ncbi:MAG: hypothetical protein ACOVRN_00650 [Flavobacterium sp.]